MKFTRKIINIAILLVVLSTMISSIFSKPKVNLNLKTSPQDWGNGNIYYLDRLAVGCPAKTALDGFQLYRPAGNKLAYKYSCRNKCSGLKSGKTYIGKTRPNATDGNKKKSANYLDRHHVNCRNGYALQQFKLQRQQSNIFYSYTCTEAQCKVRQRTYTKWQSGGNNEVIYLDRQEVRMEAHTVITGFKLETKYGGGSKFRYAIDYCMLKHPKKTKKPIKPKAVKPAPLNPAKVPAIPRVPVPAIPRVPVPAVPGVPVPAVPRVPIPLTPDVLISAVPGLAKKQKVPMSAPLTPAAIAANAKGQVFCSTNCAINHRVKHKRCLDKGQLIPCKRCTNKPELVDPSIKTVCQLVCNGNLPNSPCDFYGYMNNKKKNYNAAVLKKFGLTILRRFR
jgi:hypothetical protein